MFNLIPYIFVGLVSFAAGVGVMHFVDIKNDNILEEYIDKQYDTISRQQIVIDQQSKMIGELKSKEERDRLQKLFMDNVYDVPGDASECGYFTRF